MKEETEFLYGNDESQQPEQEEPTEAQETLGVSGLISGAMTRLWDCIDYYSSVIATLASLEGDHEADIEIFNDILQIEYGNVAMIQSLAEDNLKDVQEANKEEESAE